MVEVLDPYFELLGIPQSEQPANCYRLLGIPTFTENKDVIANAAARQMQFLRRVGGERYLDEVQNILNEVAAARILLLNDDKRDQYDQKLRLDQKQDKVQPHFGASTPTGSAVAKTSSTKIANSNRFKSSKAFENLNHVPTIQILNLSGRHTGKLTDFREREINFGMDDDCQIRVDSEYELGDTLTINYRMGKWVAHSVRMPFVVSGRLVEGQTQLRDGDVLQLGIAGPDFQFIEITDSQTLLDKVAKDFSPKKFGSKKRSTPADERGDGNTEIAEYRKLGRKKRTSGRKRKSQEPVDTSDVNADIPPQRLSVRPTIPGAKPNKKKGKSDKFQKRLKKTGFDWTVAVLFLIAGAVIAIIALVVTLLNRN